MEFIDYQFNVDVAKEIQSGKIEGRILTDNGDSVEIIKYDLKSNDGCNLVCIVTDTPYYLDGKEVEYIYRYDNTGKCLEDIPGFDLHLRIPKYYFCAFKKFDFIEFTEESDYIGILNRINIKESSFDFFALYNKTNNTIEYLKKNVANIKNPKYADNNSKIDFFEKLISERNNGSKIAKTICEILIDPKYREYANLLLNEL